MVDLSIDFLKHLRSENHAFVAAFKMILPNQIGVLMKNHLVHIELVEISIQQRYNDRVKFHFVSSLP